MAGLNGGPLNQGATLRRSASSRFDVHQEALFLVGTEHEKWVARWRGDALKRGEFFRDERGDTLQTGAIDEDEEVVAAGHEITGFDLVKAADALGEAIEAAAALGA